MTHLRRLALLLWLSSWLAPTALSQGGQKLLGYEVVAAAIGALVAFPPVLFSLPLYWLSLATNILFVVEGIALVRRRTHAHSLGWCCVALAALLLNAGVVWHVHAAAHMASVQLPGLLGLPGAYLWLMGFLLLATGAVCEQRAFFAGLIARVALTALVAAVLVAAAFGVVVLMHR